MKKVVYVQFGYSPLASGFDFETEIPGIWKMVINVLFFFSSPFLFLKQYSYVYRFLRLNQPGIFLFVIEF